MAMQGCNSALSLAPGNLEIKILGQVQVPNRLAMIMNAHDYGGAGATHCLFVSIC